MKNLVVTIAQLDLVWESPRENLTAIEKVLSTTKKSDIVVFPEMVTTGFSMNSAHLAERMDEETVTVLSEFSKRFNTAIVASFICKSDFHYYNRLLFVEPDGTLHHYDKRHLFRMAKEDDHFSPGSEELIVEYKGWKIKPLVCYDLRFPVWSRNRFETDRSTYVNAAYDVLIYIANWPKARVAAWDKLLLARSIENQAYVIGVNRVGEDGNGILYSGNSTVIDPKGEPIIYPFADQVSAKTCTLDYTELKKFRKKFPVGMDADYFYFSS